MGSQDPVKPHCCGLQDKAAVCSNICHQNQPEGGADWLLGHVMPFIHTFIDGCCVPSTVLVAGEMAVNKEGQGGQGNDTNDYLNVIVGNATEWKYMWVCK